MKKTMMLVFLFSLCLGRLGPSDGRSAEDRTCCSRELGTLPVAMPAGQQNDLSGWFAGAVDSAQVGPSARSNCPKITFVDTENAKRMDDLIDKMTKASRKQGGLPPLPADNFQYEKTLDYLFRGTLTAQQITGKTPVSDAFGYEPGTKKVGGDLIGTFNFNLKLEDPDHNATVKEASCSWTGSILDALGFWRSDGTQDYMIQNLSRQFQPLEQLIRDYERIPEKCQVKLPQNEIEAGKTVTIQLTDLLDSEGRPTQPWQRVLVKVKRGKILNGEARALSEEAYRVFKVGNGGTIDVQYQAPDKCESIEENLVVYNTCEKGEAPGQGFAPKREIGKKDFNIVCNRWSVELTFNKTVAGKEQLGEGGMTRQVGGSYSATVKAVVEYVKSQGSDRIFESKSAELDLNDTFWQHLVLQSGDLTCEGRISWTGTHNGTIQVPVIMKIHTRANRCSFGFGRPGGDPITYKMAVNLWGDDRCGGARAWNGESQVKDALFDATGVDVIHVPKPIPFSPGQKVVSGQDQWDSTAWLVRSWGALSVPMEQFPALWRPMLALLKVSSLISKKIPANMTLSWKATKLGQKN